LLEAQKLAEADVAIVFDYPSNWAWDVQPQGQSFNYFRLVYDFYRALRRAGKSVDILPSNCADFGDRKLVVIPGLFAWNENLKSALKKFKGKTIIGPRSGSKTQAFHIPSKLPPEIPGMSVHVTSVESLSPSGHIPVQDAGGFHIWREFTNTSENVALRSNDGHPALISGNKIHYLCGWPNDELLDTLLSHVGLKVSPMPEGVRVRDIGRYRLFMNYNNIPVEIDGQSIEAAGIKLVDTKTNSTLIEN